MMYILRELREYNHTSFSENASVTLLSVFQKGPSSLKRDQCLGGRAKVSEEGGGKLREGAPLRKKASNLT